MVICEVTAGNLETDRWETRLRLQYQRSLLSLNFLIIGLFSVITCKEMLLYSNSLALNLAFMPSYQFCQVNHFTFDKAVSLLRGIPDSGVSPTPLGWNAES